MKPGATPEERLDGWFKKAIEKLKELDEKDGGIASLMITIPLYERYIVSKLKSEGKKAGKEEKLQAIANDLSIANTEQAGVFWIMYRNGLAHSGMPMIETKIKGKVINWELSSKHGPVPMFEDRGGITYICLDPRKFADRTIGKFTEDASIITVLKNSFPMAEVSEDKVLPGCFSTSGVGNPKIRKL